METVLALCDQLEAQLVAADRLASNRAEHLRLTQLRSTVAQLRAELHVATATAA